MTRIICIEALESLSNSLNNSFIRSRDYKSRVSEDGFLKWDCKTAILADLVKNYTVKYKNSHVLNPTISNFYIAGYPLTTTPAGYPLTTTPAGYPLTTTTGTTSNNFYTTGTISNSHCINFTSN